jgi:hypothetical protein
VSGKTYERAFMADLAAINKVCPVVPDYVGGMPSTQQTAEQLNTNEIMYKLVTHAYEQGEVVGNDILHRYMMAWAWKDMGRPTFIITPELAAALLLSDLPSVITEQPPFPAFTLLIKTSEGLPTPVVAGVDGDQDIYGLGFLQTDMAEETEGDNESWAIWGFPQWEPDQSFYQKVPHPRQQIPQWVKDHPETLPVHRLLVNFCAYVASKKADGTLPAAKKVKRGQRKGCSVTRVGAEVNVSRDMIIYAREIAGNPKFKIGKRFIVRGHWRKQRYGKRTEDKTKTIWILPFWKGEGAVEAAERVYRVEGK